MQAKWNESCNPSRNAKATATAKTMRLKSFNYSCIRILTANFYYMLISNIWIIIVTNNFANMIVTAFKVWIFRYFCVLDFQNDSWFYLSGKFQHFPMSTKIKCSALVMLYSATYMCVRWHINILCALCILQTILNHKWSHWTHEFTWHRNWDRERERAINHVRKLNFKKINKCGVKVFHAIFDPFLFCGLVWGYCRLSTGINRLPKKCWEINACTMKHLTTSIMIVLKHEA